MQGTVAQRTAPRGAVGEVQRFDVRWATSEGEVREAQRLRYRIFAGEMGASLPPASHALPGLDADRFDPFCDHLLVRPATAGDGPAGPLVGTYRVLPPAGARRAGGLYTDMEFDTTPLRPLLPRAVELGRSCVHPDWRSGGAILAMWSALCRYMVAHDLQTMIGCASVALDDGGTTARCLWSRLRHTHLAEARWRVRPRTAYPVDMDVPAGTAPSMVPPLIKGYLRCGARLLGPPAHDASFNTADLPMMMHLSEFSHRYRRHFLGD
jgi:putative hemolysin